MSRPTPVWIAEKRVIFVHPDGRRVAGHIAVGQPYTLGGGDPAANYEAHCPIEIDDLYAARHPAIGGGTLKALVSAVELAGMTLNDFVSRGGRILHPEDGTDLNLEAVFGPLLRAFPTSE